MSAAQPVTRRTGFDVVGSGCRLTTHRYCPQGCQSLKRVQVTLSWSPADPFTVVLDFLHATQGLVRWVASRELLAAGLHGPAGLGDVRLCPVGSGLELVLSSHSGRISFLVARRMLREFLAKTWEQVPAGAERAPDPDRWLRAVTRNA